MDKIEVEYIILESVERLFVRRSDVNFHKKIDKKDLIKLLAERSSSNVINETSLPSLTPSIVKFPIRNIQYMFVDRPYGSKVYKVPIKEKLFSNMDNNLLFYRGDIDVLPVNNNVSDVTDLNITLNRISNILDVKGAKLIVVPAVDKYDAYWEYIIDKTNYPEPLFFKILDTLQKNYISIDSKKIIKKAIIKEKDIYFYDDTHLSPIGMKIIANELIKKTN